MCTVSINIDETTLRQINPLLTSRESIGSWLQHQVDMMIEEMTSVDKDTIELEELRAMLHETVREEYARGRAESRKQALEKDITPEQLYSLISEEIDEIYANGSPATPKTCTKKRTQNLKS